MPPSQLKRLKASLREQGIVGPQQSKKQGKKNVHNGVAEEKRVHKVAALKGIREQFNPFEVTTSAKRPKFDVTTYKTLGGRISKGVQSRRGVTKGLGEDNRRKTLLVELQRRNKVGGITDRRFGEDDPSMAPEDKMLERFTQEKQRRHRNAAFDLEDDDFEESLTHLGQSLSLNGPTIEGDFDESNVAQDHEQFGDDRSSRARPKEIEDADAESESDAIAVPEIRKSKQAVMQEVIAKSKLYKYERQAAKDEDEDLREELDKELPNLQKLLRDSAPAPVPALSLDLIDMNPDRAAILKSTEKAKLEKEYDLRLRQMAQDKRSKPSERTKTEEEKAFEASRTLYDLEQQRLRRMQAVVEDSDPEDSSDLEDGKDNKNSADNFGLGLGIKAQVPLTVSGVEDEDEFLIDDDLVASSIDSDYGHNELSDVAPEGQEDDSFFSGLLTEEEAKRPEFLTGANASLHDPKLPTINGVKSDLAYTFPCPQNHTELLEVFNGAAASDLPLIVQRIRAIYHPKLSSENKGKMSKFAISLVDHVSYVANTTGNCDPSISETVIRHIHSLAKLYPVEIANAFREHLQTLHLNRPLSPTAGDLTLLTAIGTIFPISDHFHQVGTPAMISIARYLGQKIPLVLTDLSIGTYLCTLGLQYQTLSKRYIPEVINFLQNSICLLAPKELSWTHGFFPRHAPREYLRIVSMADATPLRFGDCIGEKESVKETASLKVSLLETNVVLLGAAVDTWTGKLAFTEVLKPALSILKHLEGTSCCGKLNQGTLTTIAKVSKKLEHAVAVAKLARRPLELHHHRPLAIKMSIPRFEDSFDPDKHYDPNRERAELTKLRAQHKKERKGAMRELRKDANFIARESLREKKERDAAHEKKMKRLMAEIQGEEGREARAYEKEKQWRKKSKK